MEINSGAIYQNNDNKRKQQEAFVKSEIKRVIPCLSVDQRKRKEKKLLVVNPFVSPSETKKWIRERLNWDK